MECELNPRIPYTELSHIIKKQKEVWPRVGRRIGEHFQTPLKGSGEVCGCAGPEGRLAGQ